MTPNRVCKSVNFKSKQQLEQFKKRQTSPIEGTLKIVLGKQTADSAIEIWYEEFKSCSLQELRELHSNEVAFECAALFTKACHKLSSAYGYFLLNQNMIFKTVETEQRFVWINPDFFSNQSKIFLPESHEGELSMIKGLLNNFKLWLHTDYTLLSQAKTLEELEFKISSSKKKKNASSNANSTMVESDNLNENKNSNSTSKHLDDKLSFKSKNIGNKFVPSVKGSEQGYVSQQKTNKIQFKHIFNNPTKNNGLSSKHSESAYEKQDEFPEAPSMSSVSRTTGTGNHQKLFPSKTTSAKSNKILQLIKNADSNPDEYVPNNIKIDEARQRQLEEQEKLKTMKKSLNEVGEELDNLFLSNMEEEEEDDQEAEQREKEFEDLLN